MSGERFEYVVIGSGIGGLLLAALLARRGARVCLLERHSQPGGYGHSFVAGGYLFCAELHYLWNCGPEDDFGILLRRLGLEDEIRFSSLDPDGFDRFRFPSFHYDMPQGFDRNVELLAGRFPQHRRAIARYFEIISEINAELYQLPLTFSAAALLQHPLKFKNVLRFRNWTTQDLFQQLHLPLEVRSILAGQSGDLGLPPDEASLLIQAAITCGYNAGAYVPAQSYEHLFGTIADFIDQQPGCRVCLQSWVVSLEEREGRILAAHTRSGRAYQGERFIYNGDPKLLPNMLHHPGRLPAWFQKRLDYEYSHSSFTVYLGLRDVDLSQYGFGNWNVWHYQHDDITSCYRQQLQQRRMEDPMLFMSTPTLHHKGARIAPADCHQLVVATPCNYDYFAELRQQGKSLYQAEKDRVTSSILDQIERHYIRDLRQHLDLVVAGTPVTNERFVLAPRGNAYGANLTPKHINFGKLDYRSPFRNLWLIGATAGVPSFAGGTHFVILLYEQLTGDDLRWLVSGKARRERLVAAPAG